VSTGASVRFVHDTAHASSASAVSNDAAPPFITARMRTSRRSTLSDPGGAVTGDEAGRRPPVGVSTPSW
jgi:hypothetical protein